jgi:hypothetical protein
MPALVHVWRIPIFLEQLSSLLQSQIPTIKASSIKNYRPLRGARIGDAV